MLVASRPVPVALGSKALHVHEGLSVMPSTHCYAPRLNCCSTTHTVLLVLLLGQAITLAAGDATHVMNGAADGLASKALPEHACSSVQKRTMQLLRDTLYLARCLAFKGVWA